MLTIEIPDYKTMELEYLVLDYNGTLAVDGEIPKGVRDRLVKLAQDLKIYVLTADTRGNAQEVCKDLPVTIQIFPNDGALQAKCDVVEGLGADRCITVGNGRNDKLMCRVSALAIAVLEKEGMCGKLLGEADVLVKSIEDGLDLLLKPKRLIATLRG